MNENEQKAGSVADQKSKIRERYKGIDPDELDVIPALPQEDIFAVENEQRVAVYARVSTDDPRQTSSYELQKNHYHDVISKSPNWKLVQIYADEGISGTSLQHRDQFKLMIEDCKKGQIDLIVTKSVSRFARNVVDCIGYVRELLSLPHPVGVFFETERLNTFDPKSEMVLSFMATLAQEESHTKSEIMNASIEMRFRRGIFLTPILLGYDHDEDGNLIINEGEAKIVKLIFMMYLNGCTCQEIADTLTGLGCETKKGNTIWSPGSILQILQNERHCGDVLAHKTYTPNYLNHKSKSVLSMSGTLSSSFFIQFQNFRFIVYLSFRCFPVLERSAAPYPSLQKLPHPQVWSLHRLSDTGFPLPHLGLGSCFPSHGCHWQKTIRSVFRLHSRSSSTGNPHGADRPHSA